MDFWCWRAMSTARVPYLLVADSPVYGGTMLGVV